MIQLMRYWVYENWVNDKAFVHESTCSFCNDGEGCHGTENSNDGRWLGPFSTFSGALERARNTSRNNVRGCKICRPS